MVSFLIKEQRCAKAERHKKGGTMFCAKIGGECPHRVFSDPDFVFVLMPFENSASIFDCIKRSVETLD